MESVARRRLRQLGKGDSIAKVCDSEGLSRAEFDAWWAAETAARVPSATGTIRTAVSAPVRIDRDRLGIPHIVAENTNDLFVGFGHAMAADRLFQMDYLRRKASGRLSEVLGPEAVEADRIARTVGLRQIAEAEWATLSPETRALVEAFARGVNALIEATRDRPPIEFDLLDYRPEPWSPVDCVAIEVEFRWYLTGRLHVIAIPELVKRTLGDGPLYRAFLTRESDSESVVPAGSYEGRRVGGAPAGTSAGDPEASTGSNNWVVAGQRTPSGAPIVASDPHVPFEVNSWWFQVHLDGGPFHIAGMTYVGMPAVMFGRNRRVAWGCTNNICSLRDLYQERTDPEHPDCFLYDGRWEPARHREEEIAVKGREPIRLTIVSSRNGPIADAILPPAARETGPVALKWLGSTQGGWLTALLAMNQAGTAQELREAMRSWHVPTFAVVFADADGHIGCQITGRIPLRSIPERGYRPGWDPAHQWSGLIPFEGMPHLIDPKRGWIATANSRPVPDDYPYPMSGTWSDDLRVRRIRQMIEALPAVGCEQCSAMHMDVHSVRAADSLPHLLRALSSCNDPRVREAVQHLQRWDFRMEPDRVGPSLFDAFFADWVRTVADARFKADRAEFLSGGINGLAAHLLAEDAVGWFPEGKCETAIWDTFRSTLDRLTNRLGADMSTWSWGRLHTLMLRHVLSGRGELAQLLDRGGAAVAGDLVTVFNTGLGIDLDARSGAGYRMIADLGPGPVGLWTADGQSQSGHPGSPHYADQFDFWRSGQYHWIPLESLKDAQAQLKLEPTS
jgi:penicillin amidase